MLLIVFLGLIAKLALVSGDCDNRITTIDNFDYLQATGRWYILYRLPNPLFDNLSCAEANYAPPNENTSSLSLQAFNISSQRTVTFNGIGTNWNGTGLEEVFPSMPLFSGPYSIVAVDYDRYIVSKFCFPMLNELFVYVSFRCKDPEEKTVKHVMKVLEKKNINTEQLVKWSTDNCQQAGPSTEEETSTEALE